eukprot:CAMPEP_0205946668 /NCGR_PEP_ID=MMETSP1325-20131115/69168_1 /ASSEMBLY_ACC=CAM_ASM_000708 /TAXON_ID=236786 /ORGANISM="Florenciella sp., Strain RCC1007" /LENGTH=136 /DNA_ID=CAMNT_0053317757 /DNA_START=82 /DNA_END=492 /DNA_ORIENTATION=+
MSAAQTDQGFRRMPPSCCPWACAHLQQDRLDLPLFSPSFVVPVVVVAGPLACRILMSSEAMVRNAVSTFSAFFALVSRKGIFSFSAYALASSLDTVRSSLSLLFPTNSLHVPSLAYRFTSVSQSATWLNESWLVTS